MEASGTRSVVYRWRGATFFRHLKICKLYDFERRQWVGFDGQVVCGSHSWLSGWARGRIVMCQRVSWNGFPRRVIPNRGRKSSRTSGWAVIQE